MSAEDRAENVRVISQHYDHFADVFDRERAYAARGWSEPPPIMNIGYWARGATTARQAQEAFVHYAAEQLPPLAGQRVLAVGCGMAGPAHRGGPRLAHRGRHVPISPAGRQPARAARVCAASGEPAPGRAVGNRGVIDGAASGRRRKPVSRHTGLSWVRSISSSSSP